MGADAEAAAVPGPGVPGHGAVSGEERIARAALTYVIAPGDPMIGMAARSLGAVRALEVIRSGSLTRITGLTASRGQRLVLERLRNRAGKLLPPREEIERTLDEGTRLRLVCPGDAEWPDGLDQLGDAAPVALWVTGAADVGLSCQGSVAVTGSRAATAYGSYLGAELGSCLGGLGHAVISGGAFGIDAAAHRGALAADGVTIVVTAGGPDVSYPAAHAELFSTIAANGALVSEAPPGTLPARLRFQARHRVIAALAAGTVIVEAGLRSGALAVATCARDLGRPVMAVPGPVTSDLSAGCNELIRSGHATLVASGSNVTSTLMAAPAPGTAQ
jgi:DNA processing protein